MILLAGAIKLFFASFVLIFIRAFQSRNVTFDHYAAVVPTSLLFAAAEVFVIVNIVQQGWNLPAVLGLGLGGGLGSIAAMITHKRVFKNATEKRARS